jgi:hypothetical protein
MAFNLFKADGGKWPRNLNHNALDPHKGGNDFLPPMWNVTTEVCPLGDE